MRNDIPKNNPDDVTPESLAAFFAAHEQRMISERQVSAEAAAMAASWQPAAIEGARPVSRPVRRCYGYGDLQPGDYFVIEVGQVVRITPQEDGYALMHHQKAYGDRNSLRHDPPKYGRIDDLNSRPVMWRCSSAHEIYQWQPAA